uniref:Uncharacterized protein n=1 Tax=Opuntia streptacantha TaxID=393608 RepID=A0A7C9DLB4_OPUST
MLTSASRSTTTAAIRCVSFTPKPPPSSPPASLSASASSAAGSTSCRSLTMGREAAGRDWLITTAGEENQTKPTLMITGLLLSLKMLGIRPQKVFRGLHLIQERTLHHR